MYNTIFTIEIYLMHKKIVSLLTNNLRVIIPDFGAFIIRQQEPRIVVFNELLKSNDGLLIDHIMKTEGVEQDVALQTLSDYTGHIMKVLESGNGFSIEGLGTLQKEISGNVTFLQEIIAETSEVPVKDAGLIELENNISDTKEPVVEFKISEAGFPVIDSDVSSKPILTRQLTRWIFIFLAANIAIVGFFLLKKDIGKLFIRSSKPAAIKQSVLDQLTDSVISAAYDTALVYDEIPAVSDEEVDQILPGGNLKYYIVAGCFRDEINADELVSSLKSLGYKAEKFGKIGDLYAVSFASFSDKELAVKELARIRDEYHPDAWMTRF